MPETPIEAAASAVSDAADALEDAAADAAQETEHAAAQPVVVIEQAAAPVADAVPTPPAMQPHEHPEISTALNEIREALKTHNTATGDVVEGAADLTDAATAPVQDAVTPVAEPVSDAVESAPRRVHALFRPLFGGRG